MAAGLHDGFCFPPFPTEGPDGVPEELGALAARALAHPEGQQHEAPQVSQQQPEQWGHGGEQRVRSHLPGLLQLRLSTRPPRALPAGRVAVPGGEGRDTRTRTPPPALPHPIRQANRQCLPGPADTFSPRRSSLLI